MTKEEFYSFSSGRFYFNNGTTSDGYSYEDLPADALVIKDSEMEWDSETNSWNFNNKFLGRIISENKVSFRLTVNPKNQDATVGDCTILVRLKNS